MPIGKTYPELSPEELAALEKIRGFLEPKPFTPSPVPNPSQPSIAADPRHPLTKEIEDFLSANHLNPDLYQDNNMNPALRLLGAARDFSTSTAGQALQAVVPFFAAKEVPVDLKAIEQYLPVEREAVSGTPGAALTPEGLHVPVFRRQMPDQAGAYAPRTGVFYGTKKSMLDSYRPSKNPGFGGTDVVSGETVFKNPFITKAGQGGPITEAVMKQYAPDAIGDLRSSKYPEDFAKVADKLGLDANVPYAAYTNTQAFRGPNGKAPSYMQQMLAHQRAFYAARESIAAMLARQMGGHDGILTYGSAYGRKPSLAEVFDIREAIQPDPKDPGVFEVHPEDMFERLNKGQLKLR